MEHRRGVQRLFDEASGSFVESTVELQVETRPFSSGAMRDSYRALVQLDDGRSVPAVLKRIKPEFVSNALGLDSGKVCLGEVTTQNLARTFARAFNALCQQRGLPEYQVDFLPVALVRLEGVDETLTLEPYLEGRYEKHSDNMGNNFTASEVPAAFSWFTYVASGGSLVVCDLQGVGARFTDPQIHSTHDLHLTLGNQKQAGLDLFARSHRCNSVAERLGLSQVKPGDAAPASCGAELLRLAAASVPQCAALPGCAANAAVPAIRGGLLHGFVA